MKWFSFLFILLFNSLFICATAQEECGWNPDFNGDMSVTIVDFIALLSVYESTIADENESWQPGNPCLVDSSFCVSCVDLDADDDGILDSLDTCLGVSDACGICNGPGPTVPIFQGYQFLSDSIFIDELNQWYPFTIVIDTIYTYV